MRTGVFFVLALGAVGWVGCSTSGRGGTGGGRDSGPIIVTDSGPRDRDTGPGGPRDSGPGARDSGPVSVRDSGPGGRDGGPVMMGDGRIGDGCASAADCSEGSSPSCQMDFMGAISFPGGYCTSTCTGPGTCPAGSQCVDIFGTMFCGRTCSSDADCRASEGYSCGMLPFGSDPTMYCLPPGA